MTKRVLSLISVLGTLLISQAALAQLRRVEGTHYTTLTPAASYEAPPGKIEVTEVFSYGCPACNGALAGMNKIKAQLPADVVMNYVHASFIPTEAWPMFQQAYITAKALGIAESTHDMMFTAWFAARFGIAPVELGARLTSGIGTWATEVAKSSGQFFLGTAGVLLKFFLMLFILFFILRDGTVWFGRLAALLPLAPEIAAMRCSPGSARSCARWSMAAA